MGWKLDKWKKNWHLPAWVGARKRVRISWAMLKIAPLNWRCWYDFTHDIQNWFTEGVRAHAYTIAHLLTTTLIASTLYLIYLTVRLIVKLL